MTSSEPDHSEIRVSCLACEERGVTMQQKSAVMGGVPQTVMVEQACRWCGGTGRRGGLRPPV